MKKILILLFVFAGLRLNAFAAIHSGAEMAYKHIAPNTYEVILKIYSNCMVSPRPATVPAQLTAPGCNAGRFITLNQVKQQTKFMSGPAVSRNCASASYMSVMVTTYTGILTFTSSEQACTDWLLSWGECCHESVTNLVGMGNMYTEAKLKLLSNLINSSPEFDTINFNIPRAHFGQPALVSALAQDPDGDSLVYSSVNPLSGPNQPIAYINLNPGGGGYVNPNPQPPFNTSTNPQVAILPNAFSPNVPLYAFHVDWTPGVSPVQGQVLFQVNSRTGNIAFTPTAFSPFAVGSANKYSLSIQVDEYRKINRVATKVGSIRRETIIIVDQGIGNSAPYLVNSVPTLSQVEMNGVAINDSTIINLLPGVTMNLKLTASDADTANTVSMISNVNWILPGAVFSQNGAKQPFCTVSWTPKAADVREQPYYFNVVLQDNANSVRAYHERTFGVRVRQNGNVTGIKSTQQVASEFYAYPNPFTEAVYFKFNLSKKAESIHIYNLLGQEIDKIQLKTLGQGEQKVQWQNAANHAAGTYIARLISENKTIQTLKFTKLQ